MSDANILQPSPAFTTTCSSASNDLLKLGQVQASKSSTVDSVKKASAGLEALDVLGKSVLQQSLSASTAPTADWTPRQTQSVQPKIPMNQMSKTSAVGLGQLSTSVTTAAIQPQPSTVTQQQAFDSPKSDSGLMPLTDIFVPLETIQPGGLAPIVAYDKNSLKIMFHFGKDRPRPDVQVVAVSVMSHNSSPVKGFVFQAAVPKVMKVKLQPASATDLPAYNPILPPAAITQVMLIAHRPQDKVLLKFKITYSLKDAMVTDVGEVQFTDNNM
jgi:ADP-ribosylation factor-binding protein GGA